MLNRFYKQLKTVLVGTVLVGVGALLLLASSPPKAAFATEAWMSTGVLFDGNMMKCSGFTYRRVPLGFIFVTARHCLEYGSGYYSVTFSKNQEGPYYEAVSGSVRWSEEDDVAFLVMKAEGDDFSIHPIGLGDEKKMARGGALFNVAYPASLGKTRFEGRFVQPRFAHQDEWLRPYNWMNAMPVDVVVTGGSSGSPIFSVAQGRVIGIIVGRVGSITTAIPASRIQLLLTNPPLKPGQIQNALSGDVTLPYRPEGLE